MEKIASDCVDHLRDEDGIEEAYCWVFPSSDALQAAQPSEDTPGLQHLCWSARAGAGVGSDRPSTAEKDVPDPPCPGAPPTSSPPSAEGGDPSGLGGPHSGEVEDFPVPSNSDVHNVYEYEEGFGGGRSADYAFGDDVTFSDVVAWYDTQAPEGQPWQTWQWCGADTTDKGSIDRIWFDQATGQRLYLSIFADTTTVRISTENATQC